MKKLYFIALGCSMALTAMAGENTGDSEWVTLEGYAKYTDAFTDVFAAENEEKVYPVLEVTIQQNIENPSIYRLVNPYKNWSNPYSCNVTYDDSKNYYMEVYTLEESGKAYISIFETGLSLKGKGMLTVESDINYFGEFYTIEDMLASFPNAFGSFDDGVITYGASYKLEGYEFPTINGWYGEYTPYGDIFGVNQSGNFKIELPSTSVGVESIESSKINSTEYYDIQGKRVINPSNGLYIKIERLGNGATQTSKVIM
ncbi:MAG: hypothetical protein HDR88_05050 [Bacteroides sp.]|nr:hypothetical protein [Bacteroides sp.]